jgi:hypothetical protein
MRIPLAVLAASAWLVPPAFAQDSNPEGFYLGAGLGDFTTDIESIDDVDDVDLDFDPDDNASKLFAGWRFNRFVAVQVDVIDFERSRDARNILDVVATRSEGVAPSLVGTLPLGPIELFARAGILFYDVEVSRNNSSLFDESSRDPIYGAGVGVTIAERVNLRAEYEVVEIDRLDDSHAVWLTAAWRF